jgi:hypothetical protein
LSFQITPYQLIQNGETNPRLMTANYLQRLNMRNYWEASVLPLNYARKSQSPGNFRTDLPFAK